MTSIRAVRLQRVNQLRVPVASAIMVRCSTRLLVKSVRCEPAGCNIYFKFISIIHLYMVRAGLLLIIGWQYSLYTAISIYHAFILAGCWRNPAQTYHDARSTKHQVQHKRTSNLSQNYYILAFFRYVYDITAVQKVCTTDINALLQNLKNVCLKWKFTVKFERAN